MRNWVVITLIVINCLLLAGCAGTVEIDNTVAVLAHGWDIDGQLKVLSAQIALPQAAASPEGATQTPKFMVITSKGVSTAEAARSLSLRLPSKPLWSMADTLIIGEKVARTDMGLFVDTAVRNPHLRYTMLCFLSIGASPEEILKVQVPSENYTGIALEELINRQKEVYYTYIPVDLKHFLFRAVTEGIEPIIPQVKIEKKDRKDILILDGIAVFKGPRLVGSLDKDQSRGLTLLTPDISRMGLINIDNPLIPARQKESIFETLTLEINDYNPRIKPVFNGDEVSFQIIIDVDASIIEQNSTQDLSQGQAFDKIEKAASMKLREDVLSSIRQAQNLESDIFGWGLEIKRRHPKEWKSMGTRWAEIFPTVKSDVKINVHLRKSYLQRKGFTFK
ncbi:MAG: Ger(x)C family spore germination protein [Syntrophomonadaceae bacterium]